MLELLDDILRPQVENLLHDLGVFSEGGREEALSLWQPVHFLCSSLEGMETSISAEQSQSCLKNL